MKKLFVAWARQRGIRRPTTAHGVRVLFAQFMMECRVRAEQELAQFQPIEGGAAGDYTYATDPIARADQPPDLLRTDGGLIDIADPERDESDFGDLVRDRAQALEDAGGDDLGSEVLLRQKKRAELEEAAPFTRIVPPSMLKGLGGGVVSVSQPPGGTSPQIFGGLSPTPSIGGPPLAFNPAQVANWVGEDAIESVPVSCAFAPVQSNFGSSVAGFRPYGIVDFGNVGFLQRFYVDVGQGVQFTVGGSRVLLSVGLDPVAGVTAPLTMQISGALSFNPIVRTTPITRTVYLDQLTASVAKAIRPPFATSVMIVRGLPGTVAVTLDFLDSAGVNLYEFTLAAGSFMTDPIPLTSDVAEIDVTKTAGNSTQARLVFFLSL